jgi:hypothetical protein
MKKILIPVIALALFLALPLYYLSAEEDNIEDKINTEFKCSKLKIRKNTFILDYKFEDVNGDNIKDNIILIGHKFDEHASLLIQEIKIIIQDGRTNKFYTISPGKLDRGYNAKLFLGDFEGDGVKDILVSIGTKGGSYYSLFSFKNGKCKHLINEVEFSKGLAFNVNYLNDFKVSIINKDLNKSYILDVSNKKSTYISLGIYSNNGELLKGNKGSYDSISSLIPIDVDKNGVYELKSIQTIWGICQVDTLGYGKALWKYNGRKMALQNLEILRFASPGSKERFQRVIPVWMHSIYN